MGALGQGTVPAYSGNMHLLIARLASEGGIASVLFSDDASRTNQMGAFTLFGSMVDIGGDAYNVWVSNQALTQGASCYDHGKLMAISLRDFLTFPFNSGRGIRMNQIDGAQLHFVTSSWDDVDDPTHLILSPFLENVPEQALFFFRLPGVIPRKARALTARIGATNIERPLVGIDGSAIPTRLLAPNYLYGTLMDSAAARLIEPLFSRPQDFEIAVVWVDASYDDSPDSSGGGGRRWNGRSIVVSDGATWYGGLQYPVSHDYPGTSRVLRGSYFWMYRTFAPPLDRMVEVVGAIGFWNTRFRIRDSDEVTYGWRSRCIQVAKSYKVCQSDERWVERLY